MNGGIEFGKVGFDYDDGWDFVVFGFVVVLVEGCVGGFVYGVIREVWCG